MNKGPAARRPKASAKGHPPTGDFIALGPKGSRPESELKPLQPLKPPQPLPPKKPLGIPERKREPSSPLTPLGASKRPKLGSPTYSSHALKSSDGEGSKKHGASGAHGFSSAITPIEVNAAQLEEHVLEADEKGNKLRVDALLLGAIRSLKSNRSKPDSMAYLSLMYLSKTRPDLFTTKRAIEALTGILKRDVSLNIKTNKNVNALVAVMACSILMHAFQDDDEWPEAFVRVYVEDALGDRIWVDNEHCRGFVDNILTAFGTKVPSHNRQTDTAQSKVPQAEQSVVVASAAAVGGSSSSSASSTPLGAGPSAKEDEDVTLEEMETASTMEEEPNTVSQRFLASPVKHNIQSYILDLVHDQLTRRQTVENISRNLLRLLTVACGYSQVRLLVSQRIEMWLQNPKLSRPAQELLTSLALNCNTHSHEDIEVVSNLIRMRLKTKPLTNHYTSCIRELLNQHPENLGTVVKHVIYNELSNSRSPSNMALLGVMFQYKQEATAKLLAMVFQDLLTNKDDYLRASRALLREIARALRHEIDFVALCRGFMQERAETQFKDLDGPLKDRMLHSLTDLICMGVMLSVNSTVKDAAVAFNRGEKKDVSVLHEFQNNVSTIQRDAVWWLHTVVPKMFSITAKDYLSCLHRVLFLEPVDSYTGKDNWPPENERSLLFSLVSDVPVQEDTLMRLIIIGLSTELPVTAPEALELADRLARKAAAVKTDVQVLGISRMELLDAVLNLCAYHHPKDIHLPSGYVAPRLAISNLYWKGWVLLVTVAALNPATIGRSGWNNFPMLKCLMEMVMTDNFTFPPPTAAETSDMLDEMVAKELQIAQAEKEDILMFETHLAAATTGVNITESNSLLLTQLISMDPVGPARRPPPAVIEGLKNTNKSLKLGQMLCRSRSPDFLLDIIQRQGASQSMPWLAELVQSSEGSLDVLPVQCLCEFLLLDKTADSRIKEPEEEKANLEKRLEVQKQVLSQLRSLLFGQSADAESTVEVLDYFMRRLASPQTSERDSAVKGLQLVLSLEPSSQASSGVDTLDEVEEIPMVTTVEEYSFPSSPKSDHVLNAYDWLLTNLPVLPHFDAVRTTCCIALRQSCHMEIIPQRLQAYLIFLSEHFNKDKYEDMISTTVDVAQLIVERPTILTHALESKTAGLETYQALLKMFSRTLLDAIEAQENSFSWPDNQEQLFVQWSQGTEFGGKAATFHVTVLHAMIVLLTYGIPKGDAEFYSLLLNAWCPQVGQVKVYLTDTGEEAILLEEWLRLRMIRSDVPQVVQAAISNLIPAQLVLFAQSFGIPVSSMSQLLQQLDVASEEDPVLIEEAVLDKGYMVQLVEVQQLRGAVGGDVFCALLTGQQPFNKTNSAVVLEEDGRISPLLLLMPKQQLLVEEDKRRTGEIQSKAEALRALKKILMYQVDESPSSSLERHSLQEQIKKDLTREVIGANRGNVSRNNIAEHLTNALIEMLNSSESAVVVVGMFENPGFCCGLLRLLRSLQTALIKTGKECNFLNLIRKLSRHASKGGLLGAAITQYKKQLEITDKETVLPEKALQLIIHQSENGSIEDTAVRQFLVAAKEGHLKPSNLDNVSVVKACLKLKESGSPLYEEFVRSVFTVMTSEQASGKSLDFGLSRARSLPHRNCVEILTKLLSDGDAESQGVGQCLSALQCGLAVDWYEMFEPEVVNVHPLQQRQLLFNDRSSTSGDSRLLTTAQSPNLYLLALLTHQTSWSTLQDTLDWLLTVETGNGKRIDPTSALDFVWTCIHIPRLWQGRDQRSAAMGSQQSSMAEHEEPVLNLTNSHIFCLVNYILAEVHRAVHSICQQKGLKSEELLSPRAENNTLNSFGLRIETRDAIEQCVAQLVGRRLSLLLLCCHGNAGKLRSVVTQILKSTSFVANRFRSLPNGHYYETGRCISIWPKWLVSQFLVLLYLAQPRIVSWLKDFKSLLKSGVYSNAKSSKLDVLCHRLISTLADSKPGKDYEDRAYNTSLQCRKLAVTHPMLLLRQLPVMAALLRGRTHLTTSEFSNQQHLLFFSHVLGLMDQLRPHIFQHDKFIQEGLRDTLQAYFGLVQSGCLRQKDHAGIVSKLMEFVHHYCLTNLDQALSVLHLRAPLLQDLSREFPDLAPLKCILSVISVPRTHSWVETSHTPTPPPKGDPAEPMGTASSAAKSGKEDDKRMSSKFNPIIMPLDVVVWTPTQLAPFIQKLAPHQPVDGILKVLTELDETSKRRVDILQHFLCELCRLLTNAHCACRTKAHVLLLRHIRQNPSDATRFVDSYMQCLNSTKPEIILTAANYLPEYIVLCQEYAMEFLQKLFSLAVYEAVDVGGPLLLGVQIMNLD